MLPIHIDCRHYRGSEPCGFHKKDGRSCGDCDDFERIRSRLLVVKLGAAGDVLRTTSLLPALAREYEGAHVTWITDPPSAPVLRGHPLIDRLLTSDACLPALMAERFDVVYGLEAEARSAALATLARTGLRLGYVCDDHGRVVPASDAAIAWWLMGLDDRRKRENRLTYQQLMYDLCGLPGPIERPLFVVPEASRARAAMFLGERGIERRAVGLNTGGGRRWAQKKWTVDGYEAFIALCRQRHPDAAIVVLGGPEEAALNERLVNGGGDGVFDGGSLHEFADFAAIVESMDVLVTSDSLGLHTAIAVQTPAVAFVGPTAPWEIDVFGDGAVVHAPDVECLGCYQPQCDKPVTCMERLEPQAVLAQAERFLSGSGSRPGDGRARMAPGDTTSCRRVPLAVVRADGSRPSIPPAGR